ncbi:MAG TPA: 5-histidylcysteine sulfoxide synthase, partial [Blastocatellia bacterium]|nr:5-histidylcysteine sulfoxide synthase [Blastocatellia bacterium]
MAASVKPVPSRQPVDLRTCTRRELRDYFINAWELQDTLFQSLTTERALYLNPDPLRNPLIFYLGHPAAFYVNRLKLLGLLKKSIHPHFEDLFAVGVDPETAEELHAVLKAVTWPAAAEVWAFRAACFEATLEAIERLPIELPITDDSPAWGLLMSIEHDRIHLETSSMLFRQLPAEMLRKPDAWQYAPTHGAAPPNEMLSVPGGAVRLGKDRNYPVYGWDNEYGSLTVEVAPFRASKYLVTNGEYLAFMQDNGYQERRYWDDESWTWREQHNVTRPKFWAADGDDFRYRTVFDEIALPWDWPVEVNHHEAMAYCRWQGAGARLLTEAEWN